MLHTPLRNMNYDPYKHKARTIESLAAESRAAIEAAEADCVKQYSHKKEGDQSPTKE